MKISERDSFVETDEQWGYDPELLKGEFPRLYLLWLPFAAQRQLSLTLDSPSSPRICKVRLLSAASV
jgi:hypothetical protein